MHNLGDALIKQNQDGAYRPMYLERKKLEILKAPDLQLIVHHKRAMRYMEKRYLRDLWRAWRLLQDKREDGLGTGDAHSQECLTPV